MATYKITAFRKINHGVDDENAHCRICKESKYCGDVTGWARDHCRKLLHTVDVYRENHTEYTCFIK